MPTAVPKTRKPAAAKSAGKPSLPKGAAPRWERKADERPEALFEAAMRVFSDRGYRAARLEEVAEAAGVSKGTVYRYFLTKEDLLEKALDHRRKHMLPAVEAALGTFEGTSAEKLRFFMGHWWKKCRSGSWGSFHRLMFGEVAHELPELFERWARQSLLRAWRMIEGILREGQERGEFRPDVDVKALARFLYSGLSHQALLRIHMGFGKFDPMAHDRVFAAALDFALRGLRADASSAPPSAPSSAGKKS